MTEKKEIVITGTMVLNLSCLLGIVAMLIRFLMGSVFQLVDWIMVGGLIASMLFII